ncbi:MAG: hypothetical protein L0154_16750 [Chloroflexi bacterium]|nr:hypothetical protein [Chloroflexota bacterium]
MKTLTIFVAAIFILIPVVQAQDGNLEDVIAAYEGYAGWTSYAAQSSVRMQLAYSLNTQDESFSRTQSTLRGFDALYDVGSSSVEGEFTEQQTGRVITGRSVSRPSELSATLDVIGIDGTVYVAGEMERDADSISMDEFAEAGDEFEMLRLDEFADFSEFRDINEMIALLEDTGSVVSVERTTTRQYEGELMVYELAVDVEQALEVLGIDLQAQFAQLLEHDAIDDQALLEAMAENTDLSMTVFLDAETGALVAENIILLINIEWENDQIAGGSLFIEYSSDYLVRYDAINQPVDIVVP